MNHPEPTAKTPPSKIGLFATLRGQLRTKGSSARRHAALAVAPVIALCALLAPAAASATAPGLVPVGQFESNLAVGIGVDNSGTSSQGDLYVGSYVNLSASQLGHIDKLDPLGSPISPPSPFGEAAVYSGTALDPANGDVYSLSWSFAGTAIAAFDPQTGAAAAPPFPVPGSNNFLVLGFFPASVVGIAFDSSGDLYVPVANENEVLEYEPTGTNEWALKQTFTAGSGSGALEGPVGVVLDSSGDLWVADSGNERIVQLSSTDQPLAEVPAEGVQSLALDSDGHLFAVLLNAEDPCGALVSPCPHLVEYGAAGARLADLGAGAIGAQRGENEQVTGGLPDMVAVDDSTGRVYVTEAVIGEGETAPTGRVLIYAPPTAPSVDSELAVGITTTQAKLGALLKPGGIDTSYRFDYGTTTAYGHSAPYPEGDAGTGLHPRTVWASPSDLQPGTTYHYRVVVSNELGTVEGEDKTFTTPTAAQVACPNDAFRTGFSAALPDCRAYELVTPANQIGAQPDKDNRSNEGALNLPSTLAKNFSSPDGERMSFQTEDVMPGSKSFGLSYLASRGATGWSFENLFPATNAYEFECPFKLEAIAYSADLSKALIPMFGVGNPCGPESELVPGEAKGEITNLLLRDNETGSYQLINPAPPGITPTEPLGIGGGGLHGVVATPDFSHIYFEEEAKLTPDAIEGAPNIYEWHSATLHLLPGFTSVSADGTHVFYTEAGKLYATTSAAPVQLDASQASGPGGGGHFLSATADGSQVFFTDDASAALTADTQSGSGANLYRYDFATETLTDLTPAAHAEVTSVLSVSRDGTSVYFAAQGALAPGATQGQSNLFIWHPAATAFLTPLAGTGLANHQISANGVFLAFESGQSLTGYDNLDQATGNPVSEIYLFDAATDDLLCASCNPSGEAPLMGANALAHQPGNWLPAVGAGFAHNGSGNNITQNLTENGRVFFDSSEALLPSDTNGTFDVYEFEPGGVGSCNEAAGCLFLISSGTGSRETFYIAAGANGNDVFLREFQALVPADRNDEQVKIYDVRVDGGFPEPTAPPACTTADACRPAPQPQPSISTGPASSNYTGPGNEHPAHKHHKKKHHKKHKRRAHRTAGHNQGGGK